MSFNTALSSGNYDSLRGTASVNPRWHGKQFLSLCPNTTIFAARVNQVTFTASFAQVTFDTVTTGAFTVLLAGQTVYLSRSNDIRAAYFVGRVRADASGVVATSVVLNINETSADVDDNDYLFVINDFRLWDKLAREVANVQRKDYALTFRQLPPVIHGLRSAYVGVVSGSPSGFTTALTAQAYAATSGATISSYAWTVPTGGTVTGGATNTASVTVRWDTGFYWLKLVVTDSGSRTSTRYIPIWSVPTDFSAQVALGFTGASITRDSNGSNATIEAFDGISSVYDHTLCVLWTVEHYNDSEVTIVANVDFVGRLRTESNSGQTDDTYSYLQSTSFEIEGAGSQLARLTAPQLALVYDASPTVWDEITALTIWRAIVHVLHEHSTFLTLYGLVFDSTAATFLAKILNTQGSNLLALVQDLAQSINAVMEFDRDGNAEVNRDLEFETTANRNAAVTVAAWTTQDFTDLRLALEHMETVGRVDGAGGTFSAAAGNVIPLLAIAPGSAQGQGEGRSPLQRQILGASVAQGTAQSELNTRVGHQFAAANPTHQLTITHPDGYHWLVPSVRQWYTWTMPNTTNLPGRPYTTSQRWKLTQVTVTHDNESGGRSIEASYRLETEGVAGQTVTYPAPAQIPTPISTIPPFNPYDSFPELPDILLPTTPIEGDSPPYYGNPNAAPTIAKDGNAVMLWSGSELFVTPNFLASANPTWLDVTPDSGITIVDAVLDALTSGAFVLATTSENWVETFDLTSSDGGWTASPAGRAVYSAGVGWIAGATFTGLVQIQSPAFSSSLITSVTMTLSSAMNGPDKNMQLRAPDVDGTDYTANMGTATSKTITISGGVTTTGIWVGAQSDDLEAGEVAYAGAITSIILRGTGVNPFGASTQYAIWHTDNVFKVAPEWTEGAALIGAFNLLRPTSTEGAVYAYDPTNGVAHYLTDSGVTDNGAVAVGASPGSVGGGDVIRIGVSHLFGANEQVKIATAAGGAFSSYGGAMDATTDPACIVIPRYQFGSTTVSNATSTPQFLLGSTVLSAGNAALWRVTASGVTFADITPQVTEYGRVVSGNGLAMPWFSGHRIAAILVFDTTRRLMTTTTANSSPPTWTNRGALTASADHIRFRRGDSSLKQLFFVGKSDASKPCYSPNFGATLVEKASPTTNTLLGIEPYG